MSNSNSSSFMKSESQSPFLRSPKINASPVTFNFEPESIAHSMKRCKAPRNQTLRKINISQSTPIIHHYEHSPRDQSSK